MSGHERTYVSVEEAELRRLREQESRLRTVNRDLPERLEAIRRQTDQEMRNRLAPIEKRQQEYEQSVQNLQSELGNLERETQRRIKQQDTEFTNKLQAQRVEYRSLINEQEQRNKARIESERRERQRAVNHLQSQISGIMADAKRKNSIAQSFVVDLTKIMQETERLPHHRFAPGAMDSISRKVNDAKWNLDAGMSEAALSTAQDVYWDIADLRDLVLEKEREFMLIHQAALQSARELLEEAIANRKYEMEVGEGENRNVYELEVNHWTEGELSEYENELQHFKQLLENGRDSLSIKEVNDILIKLDNMKPRAVEIVEHARQNIIASQVRCNIAELAVESLKVEGFDLVDSAYEGDDERNAFVVKLRNIAGSEVVTVITPVKGEYGKNEVSINSYDSTYVDDAVYRQRSHEIVSAFNENGLVAAKPECVGTPDHSWRNVDKVRSKQHSLN
ncbi:MAG: hypothetical protein PHI31_15360 [Desulfuromonadaceae bacterium]|nr:hypothetical protein [Desulfuromonadaceae bacterium]